MTIVWEDDVTQLDAPHMNLLEQVARKGVANGYAALGADGLVPLAQLPPPPVIADADIPATITRDTELAAGLVVKVDKDSVVASATRLVASKLLAGDAQPAFRITGSGTISWGSGGATAPDTVLGRGIAGGLSLSKGPLFLRDASGPNNRIFFGANDDTNLYRAAANQLKTDGDFGANSFAVGNNADATMYRGAAGRIDTNASLAILYGNVQFGSPPDTTLYRASSGTLKTDGTLAAQTLNALNFNGGDFAGGDFFVDSGGAGKRVWFGSAADVSLYRAAATNLKTDGSLIIAASLVVNTDDGGGSKLYFGSAMDMTLSRATLAAAGRGVGVRSSGHFGAGADIVARDGGATQVALGYHNGVAGIEFGSAADTTLYRSAAGVLGASFGALGTRDIVYGAPDSGGAGFRMVRVAN